LEQTSQSWRSIAVPLTAQILRAPRHGHSFRCARVGEVCDGRTHALAVAAHVASARVVDAVVHVVLPVAHPAAALGELAAVRNDRADHVGPVQAARVQLEGRESVFR
jgi:hypothetical protein